MRSGVIAAAAAIGLAGSAAAQPEAHNDGPRDFHTLDNPVGEFQAVARDSGIRPNVTEKAMSVFQDTVQVEGVGWVRVYFGDVELGPGSFIRITSPLDGEVQELDADGLRKWALWSHQHIFQ